MFYRALIAAAFMLVWSVARAEFTPDRYRAYLGEALSALSPAADGRYDYEKVAALYLYKLAHPEADLKKTSPAQALASPIPAGLLPALAIEGKPIAPPRTIGEIESYLTRVHAALPKPPARFSITVDGQAYQAQGPRMGEGVQGVVLNLGDRVLKLPHPRLSLALSVALEEPSAIFWREQSANGLFRIPDSQHANPFGLHAIYRKDRGEPMSIALLKAGVFEIRAGELKLADRSRWKLKPEAIAKVERALASFVEIGKKHPELSLSLRPDNFLVTFKEGDRSQIEHISMVDLGPYALRIESPRAETGGVPFKLGALDLSHTSKDLRVSGLENYLQTFTGQFRKRVEANDPLSPVRREAAVYQGQLPAAALTLRPENLRTGDIIGISTRSGGTPWLVQASTLSPIDHVAVVVWENYQPFVYHYTNGKGAHRVPLDTFLKESVAPDGEVHFTVGRMKKSLTADQENKLRDSFHQLVDPVYREAHHASSGCSAFLREGFGGAGLDVGQPAQVSQGYLDAFDGSLRMMWRGVLGGHGIIPPVSLLMGDVQVTGTNLPGLHWSEKEMLEAWRKGDASKIARLHEGLFLNTMGAWGPVGGSGAAPFLERMRLALEARGGHTFPLANGVCPWHQFVSRK